MTIASGSGGGIRILQPSCPPIVFTSQPPARPSAQPASPTRHGAASTCRPRREQEPLGPCCPGGSRPPAGQSRAMLEPPRHPRALTRRRRGGRPAVEGGAKARGRRPGARLPAAARLLAGARGQPKGDGGWTATARTSGTVRADAKLRGRGCPGTRGSPAPAAAATLGAAWAAAEPGGPHEWDAAAAAAEKRAGGTQAPPLSRDGRATPPPPGFPPGPAAS